jgi:hypothetical protein
VLTCRLATGVPVGGDLGDGHRLSPDNHLANRVVAGTGSCGWLVRARWWLVHGVWWLGAACGGWARRVVAGRGVWWLGAACGGWYAAGRIGSGGDRRKGWGLDGKSERGAQGILRRHNLAAGPQA